MTSLNKEYITISPDVNVTLGSAFKMCCTAFSRWRRRPCSWHRNNAIITATGRYLLDTRWLENDVIHCSLQVTEAHEIDNGNWTCVISPDLQHSGFTSDGIIVNVLTATISKITDSFWKWKIRNNYSGLSWEPFCFQLLHNSIGEVNVEQSSIGLKIICQ